MTMRLLQRRTWRKDNSSVDNLTSVSCEDWSSIQRNHAISRLRSSVSELRSHLDKLHSLGSSGSGESLDNSQEDSEMGDKSKLLKSGSETHLSDLRQSEVEVDFSNSGDTSKHTSSRHRMNLSERSRVPSSRRRLTYQNSVNNINGTHSMSKSNSLVDLDSSDASMTQTSRAPRVKSASSAQTRSRREQLNKSGSTDENKLNTKENNSNVSNFEKRKQYDIRRRAHTADVKSRSDVTRSRSTSRPRSSNVSSRQSSLTLSRNTRNSEKEIVENVDKRNNNEHEKKNASAHGRTSGSSDASSRSRARRTLPSVPAMDMEERKTRIRNETMQRLRQDILESKAEENSDKNLPSPDNETIPESNKDNARVSQDSAIAVSNSCNDSSPETKTVSNFYNSSTRNSQDSAIVANNSTESKSVSDTFTCNVSASSDSAIVANYSTDVSPDTKSTLISYQENTSASGDIVTKMSQDLSRSRQTNSPTNIVKAVPKDNVVKPVPKGNVVKPVPKGNVVKPVPKGTDVASNQSNALEYLDKPENVKKRQKTISLSSEIEIEEILEQAAIENTDFIKQNISLFGPEFIPPSANFPEFVPPDDHSKLDIEIPSQEALQKIISDLRNAAVKPFATSSSNSRSGSMSSMSSLQRDSNVCKQSKADENCDKIKPWFESINEASMQTETSDSKCSTNDYRQNFEPEPDVQVRLQHPPLHRIVQSCDLIDIFIKSKPDCESVDFGFDLFDSAFIDVEGKNGETKVFRSPSGKRKLVGASTSAFIPVLTASADIDAQAPTLATVCSLMEDLGNLRSADLREGDFVIEVNGEYTVSSSALEVRRLMFSAKHMINLVIARPKCTDKKRPTSAHTNKEAEKLKLKYNNLREDAERNLDKMAELRLELQERNHQLHQCQQLLKYEQQRLKNMEQNRDIQSCDQYSESRGLCSQSHDSFGQSRDSYARDTETLARVEEVSVELAKLRNDNVLKDQRIAQLRTLLIQQTELMEYHNDYGGRNVSQV